MNQFKYDICIIGGCGHIGLPLGIAFAHAGKKVILCDIDQNAIDTILDGKMPFMEEGAEEILRTVLNKKLFLTTQDNVISLSHFVVIVIGTPIDEHLNPRFTLFKEFLSEIMEYLIDEHHLILRSTLFPGTTEKINALLRAHGKQTKVSFCPERIAEGKALHELKSLPQIVASFDDSSLSEVKDLFGVLTSDIITLNPKEAELAKLFTNVWRYIEFSISNQFYQISTQYNLDYYKIFDAVTHNYPRTKHIPRAGFAAGPCLFKDTMQLAAFSNNNFFLGHAAMLINEGLPNYIVQRLKDMHNIDGKVVGILGMAFKGDIDDPRESLSYKLKKILEIESKEVLCSDPFVKDNSLVSLEKAINESDIIILGAPHTQYKKINIDYSEKKVVDVWNFFGRGGLF
jgi:UDP-N-acetyl-D-mannosaminuronic acid dehydrogenase